MSELAIKKRAEVAAFIALAGDITNRAGQPFAGHAPDCSQLLQSIVGRPLNDNIDSTGQELYLSKTDKTTEKLTAMMELYIGDEWDNPTEVLEWCSFYAGAGAAHCAIAAHLAAQTDGEDAPAVDKLRQLESVFRQLLDAVIGRLAR